MPMKTRIIYRNTIYNLLQKKPDCNNIVGSYFRLADDLVSQLEQALSSGRGCLLPVLPPTLSVTSSSRVALGCGCPL